MAVGNLCKERYHQGLFYKHNFIVIGACIIKYTHIFLWDTVIHLRSFNGDLTEPPLWFTTWVNHYIPLLNVDVITYPYPKLDDNLANLCQ